MDWNCYRNLKIFFDYGKFQSEGNSKMNPHITTTQLPQPPTGWEKQLNKQTNEQPAFS